MLSVYTMMRKFQKAPAVITLICSAEGVLVAKKDFNLPKHNEIDTKNLYVRIVPLFNTSHSDLL